jgi:hypothetical protein
MKTIKRILRDLALTLYDHPTEFKCLSLARLWAFIFGVELSITWYREAFLGIKFTNWMYLTTAFTACLTAYGLKKWQDGQTAIVKQQVYNAQEANMKP